MSAPSALAVTAPAAVLAFRIDPETELDAWLQGLPPDKRLHARYQELHFLGRIYERYGLRVSPRQYRHWIRKVENVLPGTAFLHATDDPQRTAWKIQSGSYTLHVLYDESTRRLVTVYTPPVEPLPAKRRHRLRRRGRLPARVCDSVKTHRRAAA